MPMANPQKITDRKSINLYLSRAVVEEIGGLLRDRESLSSVTEELLQGEITKRIPVMAQVSPKRVRYEGQPGSGQAAPQASKRSSA